ncbi:MAG: HAD hydrolase-like protein [Desulfobacterium sp.]
MIGNKIGEGIVKGWLFSHGASLDALVFDIDGVLLVKGKAAPGSRSLLAMLRKKYIPFYLLTNDGDHSTREKSQMLDALGIDVHPREIVSCAHALLEEKCGRQIFRDRVLMTGDFIKSDIQGALDFGYRSALVLTGVTTVEMAENSAVQPDIIFQTLG